MAVAAVAAEAAVDFPEVVAVAAEAAAVFPGMALLAVVASVAAVALLWPVDRPLASAVAEVQAQAVEVLW